MGMLRKNRSRLWKDFKELVVSLQLKARILYIDPVAKTVGLTLNPELINNVAPAMVLLLIIRTLLIILTSLIFLLDTLVYFE